jgi:hypothetical protein
MDARLAANFEENPTANVDTKTEWAAPKIVRLDIKRTLNDGGSIDDGVTGSA